MLNGINYFSGWWEPLPNKWRRHRSSLSEEYGEDWRPDFPDRVPELGCFNNQATMDREIEAAAGHGVDFFPILWYYNEKDQEREPNSRFLNQGVELFVNSTQAERMKFFLEFCNHPPFEVETSEQWEECLQAWLPLMRHPSYLRVDGRLVFKVHGADFLIEQNDGDVKRAQARLESLRAAVRDAGLGDMIIGGGVMALQAIGPGNPIAQLFDFTCTYMDIPAHLRRDEDYPFEMLADMARAARYVHSNDALPYMPYLPAGWNPRPWPDERATYAFPNRAQWRRELIRMRQDLEHLPNLGLPRRDGTLEPAYNIYAWNEFGEGGIVAPTHGDGTMKLEEIQAVFCKERDSAEEVGVNAGHGGSDQTEAGK